MLHASVASVCYHQAIVLPRLSTKRPLSRPCDAVARNASWSLTLCAGLICAHCARGFGGSAHGLKNDTT